MRLFNKTKETDGWLAIAGAGDGIAAAAIRAAQDGKPAVSVAFFPGPASAESIEKALRELRAGGYRCAALLGGGEYQLLAVEAPNVPADELKSAVRWRLKDMLDFPLDDATIDVLDIAPDPNAAVRAQRTLFAVAARNGGIAPRQQMFAAAKADLSVIDIPEMAQRNISALLEPEGRGVAMLSFGHDGGLLTVSYKAELYLSRRIDVTVEQLLEPDHERKHLSFDRITLELQRSLDHFERQFSFISVSKLVLAPSPATGLDAYLSSQLYMPVESLDLAVLFDLSGTPELAGQAIQQRFFLALGAALRPPQRQQVNLFNPAFERTTSPFAAAPLTGALGLLLAGVIGFSLYAGARVGAMQHDADAAARRLERQQARLTAVANQFAPRPKDAALEAALAGARAQLATLQRIAGVLQRGELGDTRGYAQYFRALARQNVDGLWLTGVSVGAAGSEIGVRGRALDPALLPGYLGRLTREPALRGKAFGGMQISQGAPLKARAADAGAPGTPAPYVEFSLQAGAPGAQP